MTTAAGPVSEVTGATKFGDLKKGMKARVIFIPDTPQNRRLREMGLNEGVEFTVAKVAPFGDTIEIRLLGYALCLRKKEASEILVQTAA